MGTQGQVNAGWKAPGWELTLTPPSRRLLCTADHPSSPPTPFYWGGNLKQGRSMTEAGSPASISSVLGLQACTTRSHLKQTPPSLEKHTHPGFEFSQFWIPGELPEISHCLQDTKLQVF